MQDCPEEPWLLWCCQVISKCLLVGSGRGFYSMPEDYLSTRDGLVTFESLCSCGPGSLPTTFTGARNEQYPLDHLESARRRVLFDPGRARSGREAGPRPSERRDQSRDLARDPLPHIDDSFATARNSPPESRTASQKAVLGLSDTLVDELLAADVIIITAAMINFAIPSTLKAYIDHVLRPGVTFRYSEKGPEGLVRGKKVYLVVARGGVYSQGAMQALNFQDPYLKAALGFVGLTDVEVLAIEGVAFLAGSGQQSGEQRTRRGRSVCGLIAPLATSAQATSISETFNVSKGHRETH